MPYYQQGELNATALIVPNVYVVTVPPQQALVNGVPTNVLGLVGTASWGPVSRQVVVGTMADYARNFGAVRDRKHDMGTVAAIAVQQGANAFRCVRVTDGTDAKATGSGPAGAISFSALYTGTVGNAVVVSLAKGTKVGSWAVLVRLPGLTPEKFDNITGTGNAFWVAVANAINNGDGFRSASKLIRATAGSDTDAPAAASYTLSGGTDGADGVDGTDMVGQDGTVRTGMYALRGSLASIMVVADLDDTTAWPSVVAFGHTEAIMPILAPAAGQSIEDAIDLRASLGLDDWGVQGLFGDHLQWLDTVNGRLRTVSPVAFEAGRLANLSPHLSPLNKPIYGVVGSERSGTTDAGAAYSEGELEALGGAKWDLICTPMPGGQYWGTRFGQNMSSDPRRGSIVYTRMTHFVSRTIERAMGIFEGEAVNKALMPRVRAALRSFFGEMQGQGMLGDYDGSVPFSVVCDMTNNTVEALGRGILQADVQVRYAPTVEKLIINLEGGQGVTITRTAV